MKKEETIGVFDSGLGGLSVLSTLRSYMPNESYLYIGDSLNAPYGTKTKEEVFSRSKAVCDSLISKGAKAIVIACNTATSVAVNELRSLYDMPIIGMEPAIKPALLQKEGKILVLATEMTLKEKKFCDLVDALDSTHRIIKCPASEWVDVVENHWRETAYVTEAVAKKLRPYATGIEALVLGCTHFIFLKEAIERFYGPEVTIFDGNMGTALQLKNMLQAKNLMTESKSRGGVEILNTKSDVYVKLSYELLENLEKRDLIEPVAD